MNFGKFIILIISFFIDDNFSDFIEFIQIKIAILLRSFIDGHWSTIYFWFYICIWAFWLSPSNNLSFRSNLNSIKYLLIGFLTSMKLKSTYAFFLAASGSYVLISVLLCKSKYLFIHWINYKLSWYFDLLNFSISMYLSILHFEKPNWRIFKLFINCHSFEAAKFTLCMAIFPGCMTSSIWQYTAPVPNC